MAGNKPPAIISLEEFTESINMLLYGDSGVGKTVLAGTAPNSLFLAVEQGTISAQRQGSKAELWPIKSWQDLQDAYDWLYENPDVYDWIIIDSLTQMQKMAMRGILDAAVAENRSRDPDLPAIQDWQKFYNMFDRFLMAFNDLPINTLYTATTMKGSSEEGDDLVMPDIQGPSYAPFRESQKACATMSVVAYLKKTVEGKADDAATRRQLLFEQVPPYFAKDRYDVFPRWVAITKGDQQVTTMASIGKKIMDSGDKPPAKKAPAKKVGAVRRRPTR